MCAHGSPQETTGDCWRLQETVRRPKDTARNHRTPLALCLGLKRKKVFTFQQTIKTLVFSLLLPICVSMDNIV